MERRFYGKREWDLEVPNLVDLQLQSYESFLQLETPSIARKEQGLESILREIFPVQSYDEKMKLEYLGHELGRPRYTPEDCRRLKLTFGAPFKVRFRLVKEEPVEEEVYLGEIPLMIGGGEFIINGSERVIVSQLHRSPGIDFDEEIHTGAKKLQVCWIIPERGSWIEVSVTKKDLLAVRIDQSGKLSATCLLRAFGEEYSSDEAILKLFFKTQKYKCTKTNFKKLVGRVPLSLYGVQTEEPKEKKKTRKSTKKIVEEEGVDVTPEDDAPPAVIIRDRTGLTEDQVDALIESDITDIEVLELPYESDSLDKIILNSLAEDHDKGLMSHEAALIEIYKRLRPGTPPNIEKAKNLFAEKFLDSSRYRLGKVGRFRLNRKFGEKVAETHQTLRAQDYINALSYILQMRQGEGERDDIDHLGNRRVRTIVELAGDEFRKGFLKLKRQIQERMNQDNQEKLTPRALINSKTISSAIEYFFGRGELSQVVDQTNPLSQLIHERRLSALGPGGLNRKRAGFEVRDVHISHYGRICPIETPEGTNIGLIASLGIFATLDAYGFLTTPYRVVKKGRVLDEIRYLRADEEDDKVLAPADIEIDSKGKITSDEVHARINGDFHIVNRDEIHLMDVSPKQLVGVSASLIPFLEHDDANRALMGSNMQRQAVPLLVAEPPIVATGMEEQVARNSGMLIRAKAAGEVKLASSSEITIAESGGERTYRLQKFRGLNERTCLNQKPIVKTGEKVKKGQVLADGAATKNGELALGRNVLVAFLAWEGYNFEDAVVISERLVKEDYYTSIHIDSFETEIRETKLGKEEFTRDIPNVSEKMLRNLDEEGIVQIGTRVFPDDILVGKVAPKSKSELSPEEKLLHEIFGRAGEDVKNDSLRTPSGVEGIVIGAEKYARKTNLTEEDLQRNEGERKAEEAKFEQLFIDRLENAIEQVQEILGVRRLETRDKRLIKYEAGMGLAGLKELRKDFVIQNFDIEDRKTRIAAAKALKEFHDSVEGAEFRMNNRINLLTRGDELPTGVLEMVRVYIATKRQLSVGDKVAGRHGNKGVIAKILPEEDMPYLEDGTPVEILLNPLGVPSRMNVGQIFETHLGWAAKALNFQAITPVFDGCREDQIVEALAEAGLPESGKTVLCDGRTGEPLEQDVTVGYIYMLKLHHLVDDKVHARATGPYSLITQQPLGGKARSGGQRFGEMEVWALEAYGAANILQELLTVKSDDVDGRTKIYESMVKGENTLVAGTPVSFEVLCNEIKGLALDIQLKKKSV